jgi:hypothetical protein
MIYTRAGSVRALPFFIYRMPKGVRLEQPAKFELVINLKDGEADWPDDRADKVIK